MKQKKTQTMQNCFNELERVCRIVVYQKIEGDEIAFFRKTLQLSLEELTKLRKIKEEKAECNRLAKIKAHNEKVYGKK